jgi:hypothetical protein
MLALLKKMNNVFLVIEGWQSVGVDEKISTTCHWIFRNS